AVPHFPSVDPRWASVQRESELVDKQDVDPRAHFDAIGIAASTGSPQWVEHIVTSLPPDLPCPVFVALHLPPSFTASSARSVGHKAAIHVIEAEDGMPVLPGTVYIGRGHQHLRVIPGRGVMRTHVQVNANPKQLLFRPSGDELLRSVATVYRRRSLGIVLSGIGRDGLEGARAIKAAGGTLWTQTKESCVVYGMPRACDEAGLSDRSLSPPAIAKRLAGHTLGHAPTA
ncbi:MAG: CheB methylesterase domain-containing protein, partial [Phycisphaeraceae bacterium]